MTIEKLQEIVTDQQILINQLHTLVLSAIDEASKNKILTECLLLDYSRVAGIVEKQDQTLVTARITACGRKSLDPNTQSKLN
jgi:hypothetical protein